MTYYADLSDYSYTDGGEPMLNVGWLGREAAFNTGAIDSDVWDELLRLSSDQANIIRGVHDCEFCDMESPLRLPSPYEAKGFTSLGFAEIRVTGEDGTTYAAPSLILHYIQSHHYVPPADFIDAVRSVRSRRTSGGHGL